MRRSMELTDFLMLLCFVLSAFFSGAETVLISASRIKIEIWQRQNKKGAHEAIQFFKDPAPYLSTTLIGNSIAVVAVSSLMAISLQSVFAGYQITLISTLLLLFFGEILPKSIGRDKAHSLFIYVTVVMKVFYYILWPLIVIISWVSSLFIRILGLEHGPVHRVFSRSDLNFLLQRGQGTGTLGEEEIEMISRLVLKGNRHIYEIMVPRTEITSVKKSATPQTLIQCFHKTGFSRIPVYDKTMDKILGMVTAKDMVLEKPKHISDILRPVLFVPDSRSIASVLTELKDKEMAMAIVIDEYGGTEGMVTLEDCLEAFVGDIQDEYDEDDVYFRNETANQLEVHSRTSIEMVNEHFGQVLPDDGDYLTVGGLLFEHFGHVPKRGERLEEKKCYLDVLSASRNKVHWVRLTRKSLADWPETSDSGE